MYRILIKIIVLAVGLVVFAARAGAASIRKMPTSLALSSTEIALFFNSASSPGTTTLHNFPSPIRIAFNYVQSPDIALVTSSSLENYSLAASSLGKLDGIAWDKLEQPAYVSMISAFLALPPTSESFTPNSVLVNNTRLMLSTPLKSNWLAQATGSRYSFFLYWKNFGELGTSSHTPQSITISISDYSSAGGQAEKAQGAYSPIINCASCHMPKLAQISRQLRGVE